ncbi:MAG: glycoside hydrolase family 2 TIM barrel-domain containing protein [Dongiaceae bacterium]
MRDRLELDGDWDFHLGDSPPAAGWRRIRVPGPWQAQLDDLRAATGTGWYRRRFRLPPAWRDGAVVLGFGAVFYLARLRLNGQPVGAHEGGFLPFELDVTRVLRPDGDNEILLEAILPSDDAERYPGMPFAEIPFGKQNWYGPVGGIWQPVWLERRPADHLTGLRLRSRLQGGAVTLEVARSRPERAARLALRLLAPDGTPVGGAEAGLAPGQARAGLVAAVPAPLPWSPAAPHLYRAELVLEGPGAEPDRLVERFGFRRIEARDRRLWLNGEPFYLRGALDQDYYPDGLWTPPSTAFLEDQLAKAKALGLNCLRCHIKVPDPRYYEVADRLGMLVWSELPSTGRSSPAARARLEATMAGILERDGHHPSIVCWTLVNENWGTDLVHSAADRAWLNRTFRWLKRADPERLVVDNSPIAPSFHVETDIEDFHYYAAMPDHRHEWERFLDAFAAREAWTFSPAGDARRSGGEPLVVSEFGNWGLPDPALLAAPDGAPPWWFETGHDWAEGVMYPHAVERRFRDWHLERAFSDLAGFAAAAQWQQFRALKYQIEAMRWRPEIAGYVVTELTDCHWESNGLLDMRRNPRAFHHRLAEVNADTVILPGWERLAYWEGEAVGLELAVAHGGPAPLEGARLRIAPGIDLAVPPLQPGGLARLGRVSLTAAGEGRPAEREIGLELVDGGGRPLARNRLTLAVHPPRRPPPAGPALWAPAPALRDRLAALQYRLADSPAAAALLVAEELDGALVDRVQQGAALLLLPRAPLSLTPFFPAWRNVRVQPRAGTRWSGDWASSFAWLLRQGPFAALPGGPLLDFAFDRVIPEHVILGCNPREFESHVLAGLAVGWLHSPVSLLVHRPYGAGRVVIATFRLFEDAPGLDPTATLLLDGLAALAVPALAAAR